MNAVEPKTRTNLNIYFQSIKGGPFIVHCRLLRNHCGCCGKAGLRSAPAPPLLSLHSFPDDFWTLERAQMVFGNFRDVKREPYERALFGQAEGKGRKKNVCWVLRSWPDKLPRQNTKRKTYRLANLLYPPASHAKVLGHIPLSISGF